MGEIRKGIGLLPRGHKRRGIEPWFNDLIDLYLNQILPIDLDTALVWGDLSASTRRAGENIAVADLLIAATALRHGLTVVTRNIRDFAPTGVNILNPWATDLPT